MATIYVACFSSVVSGGPELLHQLCFHLRNEFSLNSKMYYFDSDHDSVVADDYKIYNNPIVSNIDDSSDNVLIVTEHSSLLAILNDFKKIRKVIWFLSVDNYYLTQITRRDFVFKRAIAKIMRLINVDCNFDYEFNSRLMNKYSIKTNSSVSGADLVLTNSVRGMLFLKDAGLVPRYLSEYLNDEFFIDKTVEPVKENIVVYNPNKGYAFTKKIIHCAPMLKFVPLSGMSRSEVIELLSRAKLYIDFGYHPGKDRLPREAAVLGCCVITSRKGSAGNRYDVAIPERYKFDCKKKNLGIIVAMIQECIDNYALISVDFQGYRNSIRLEKYKFLTSLQVIVRKYLF